MNWLGAGLTSLLGALLGALAGALAHGALFARGVDVPPLVALLAGLGALLGARERSVLRGVFVASLAVWAGATAEVVARPSRGLFADLLHFSERLTALRFALYVVTAALGVVLASRLRPAVHRRDA